MDRFAATTEHLRETACDLLLRNGPRAFTQEALAKFAFVSVGAVYERWSSRDHAIADVVSTMILPSVAEVAGSIDFESRSARLEYMFDSPEGRKVLRLATEALFAARDDASLLPQARETLASLARIVGRSGADGGESAVWWLTNLLVGWGMLLSGDLELPMIGAVVATVDQDMCDGDPVRRTSRVDVDGVTLPDSPAPIATDGVGSLVKGTVRELLAESGPTGLHSRDVTSRAGVSTGALYRRFPSRSELLRAVLIDEVQSERYQWTKSLVDALSGTDPLQAVVDVILDALLNVYDDTQSQAVILELTVAARVEPTLREQLLGQIMAAVRARSGLMTILQDVGVVGRSMSAGQIAWLFQAPPIGARLLASLGFRPGEDEARKGLERVVASFLSGADND